MLAKANAANFLITLIFAPLGFYSFGITGFIGGWILGNLTAVIVLDWELIRHGVPVARQDVQKTLFLVAFVVAGRVIQHFLDPQIHNESLKWIAAVVPAMLISLVGLVTIFVRNRHFEFVRSGAV